MRLTQTLLKKLETLLEALGYTVRYEKGNFRGGSCIVEERKLVMVNKFSPLESRISTLMDVLMLLEFEAAALEPEDQKLLRQVRTYRLAAIESEVPS